MRRMYIAALAAALLTTVAAAPAQADWDRLGSVAVSRGDNTATAYDRFGGRVEALNLTARNADVRCRDVTVTFGNGQTRTVFTGVLARGRDRAIDLPGRERLIRRIDFNCRPAGGPQASIDIAAEVGNFRDEWRRSPDWETVWSRTFRWEGERVADRDDRRGPRFRDEDRGNPDNRGWTRVAVRSFVGRGDTDSAYPGFEGRDVNFIGLRPLNDDAECSNVTATFRNGQTRSLEVDNFLRQDRIVRVDLPGRDRDVSRVNMTCHAVNGRQVNIEVLTQG